MKLSEAKKTYTFDDMMLVPQYSKVPSRKSPDVSTKLGKIHLRIPIVSSPMNTITEHAMIAKMNDLGGVGVLHRYMSADEQIQQIVKSPRSNYFIAIGAVGDYLDRALHIYDTLGTTNFCIDVANGHSEICLRAVEELRKKIPTANIMAGNVCSYIGAFMLADVGVDIIRCGVGGGSMCKTRIVSGHGVPQLSALEDCVRVKENRFSEVSLIADGGIRNSGDVVKALAIGCDAVMIGGLLAGTDETPGEIHSNAGFSKPYKVYAGMASEEGRKFNGWFTEEDASFIPEGESTTVPCKGPVKNVINNLVGGLRVGMAYSGAMTIKELQQNAEWVKVTNAGQYESTPFGMFGKSKLNL